MQLGITTSSEEPINVLSTPLYAHLDIRSVDFLSLYVIVWVQEVNAVAVRSSRHVLRVTHFNIVCSNHSSSFTHVFLWYILEVFASPRVVNFESLGVPLHDEQVLQLVDVEHILDLRIVLLVVPDVARVVTLDGVDESPILADNACRK